jgi:hypothetical protein
MYEEIKEIVKSESECLNGDLQKQLTRCHCGSTLVRVVCDPIIINDKEVGQEYNIWCAKCGSHVFGFTDYYECEYCPNEYKYLENRKELNNKMTDVENQPSNKLKDLDDVNEPPYKVGTIVHIEKGEYIKPAKIYPSSQYEKNINTNSYVTSEIDCQKGKIECNDVVFGNYVGSIVKPEHYYWGIFIPYYKLVKYHKSFEEKHSSKVNVFDLKRMIDELPKRINDYIDKLKNGHYVETSDRHYLHKYDFIGYKYSKNRLEYSASNYLMGSNLTLLKNKIYPLIKQGIKDIVSEYVNGEVNVELETDDASIVITWE